MTSMANTTDSEASATTPEAHPSETGEQNAVGRLIHGVEAFQSVIFPERREQFIELAKRQDPGILFITCADSRVVPEMITQTEPGDLFVTRNIGNIVPSYGEMMGGVSAVIEYAVVALKVTDIVVCGHSDCGAMKGLIVCDDPTVAPQNMPAVANWLRNAHAALSVVEAMHPDLEGAEKVQALVEQNVLTQIQHLRTHPSVAARVAKGELALHGWVYDIETGEVRVHEGDEGGLVPLQESAIGRRVKSSGA
jgi:carbonic anhydrase